MLSSDYEIKLTPTSELKHGDKIDRSLDDIVYTVKQVECWGPLCYVHYDNFEYTGRYTYNHLHPVITNYQP